MPKKAPQADLLEETVISRKKKPKKKPEAPQKQREIRGVGLVTVRACRFQLSRLVETSHGPVSERCKIEADGLDVERWPIAMLSDDFVRQNFGEGRYKVLFLDAIGKPSCGSRTMTIREKKKREERASDRRVMTNAELELEKLRMRMDADKELEEKKLALDRERMEFHKSIMERAMPAPVTSGYTEADMRNAREEAAKIARMEARLEMLEEERDADEGDPTASSNPETDFEKIVSTTLRILSNEQIAKLLGGLVLDPLAQRVEHHRQLGAIETERQAKIAAQKAAIDVAKQKEIDLARANVEISEEAERLSKNGTPVGVTPPEKKTEEPPQPSAA
jgi:hypothetical protein